MIVTNGRRYATVDKNEVVVNITLKTSQSSMSRFSNP